MKQDLDQSTGSQEPAPVRKRPYEKPVLRDYGSLTELTGTAAGSAPDGGVFQFSPGSG